MLKRNPSEKTPLHLAEESRDFLKVQPSPPISLRTLLFLMVALAIVCSALAVLLWRGAQPPAVRSTVSPTAASQAVENMPD